MLTQKQLKLFSPFAQNIFREYSYKELKADERSNNALQLAIKKFKQEGLITERKVGTSRLYRMTGSERAYSYIALLNQERLPALAQRSINILQEEIEKQTPFYALVIFGSYAIGTQAQDSDLDIAIIAEREGVLAPRIKAAGLKTPLHIDAHIITANTFLEMLAAEEENLGKQIARKHLALHNPAIFYSLLGRGVQHGFRA
jgi:predicted nucleotidyltransferase